MGTIKADLIKRVERLIPLAKDGNDFISSSEIKKQLYERVNHDQQKKRDATEIHEASPQRGLGYVVF